jgi:hypothetical protein
MCGGGNDKISYHEICKKIFKFKKYIYFLKYIKKFESHYFVYESPKQQIFTFLQFMKNKHI